MLCLLYVGKKEQFPKNQEAKHPVWNVHHTKKYRVHDPAIELLSLHELQFLAYGRMAA